VRDEVFRQRVEQLFVRRRIGLPQIVFGFHQAAAEIFRRSPRGGAAPADERTVVSIIDALRPAF